MSIDVFAQHFSCIEDPRQSAKVSYPLFDVLFLTVSAVIAGCKGWEEIEDFGVTRLDWLKKYVPFENGIPVHDTIARLIARIDAKQLRSSFISWMQVISKRTDGEVIAIDGKTLCSSYDRDNRRSAIHMVSAFATTNGVVMGQLKTDAKSNEITAVPQLLGLLELKGCLVTIDAMGCQKEIAKTVIGKGADYLLAVKDNNPLLHRAVRDALRESTLETTPENIAIEKGHGRIEYREYHVLAADKIKEDFPEWIGLKTIGVAIGFRLEKGGKKSLQYRYYISSAELNRQRFGNAVRSHWGIENKLHWVLDTAMNEDACQIYRGNAAENLASIRHIALNMLRAEKTKKASVPRKQRFAAMQTNYLEAVLEAGCKVLSDK